MVDVTYYTGKMLISLMNSFSEFFKGQTFI